MELDLCHGCMEPKTDDSRNCPACGYHYDAPYLPSYLAPGTLLNDRYYVGRLKSYNGEGALYLAFDTITQTKVTVKEYMPDALCSREKESGALAVNPNYVAQYKTFMSDFVELNKILAKMRTLNHINAAIDMFGANNTGYAVFPETEGITLSEYLKKNAGELTLEEVKRLFPPLFTTLSLVHNAGVIHRGISPENIIITQRGELKLQGQSFCISDARTANTELASELYSGYAAPEQYNSANRQGAWTDVYGMSALLYRVLTGTTPVDATGRISSDSLLEPALVNRNIPPNVSKAVMNGLHVSGEMRIQTVTELVTQLFEQPEYNSVRLSSSSTQTITIPKSGAQGGYVARAAAGAGAASAAAARAKKRTRPSRKSVFLTAGLSTLLFGLFFFIMLLIVLGEDPSAGSGGGVGGVSGIIESDAELTDGTDQTTTALEKAPQPTQKTSETTRAALLFTMNDITGKHYDVIKDSDAYASLAFKPEFEFNEQYAKGVIFEQSIEVGTTYENGAEIAVKVSLGPKYVPVPEFISLSERDYFVLLNDLGIKYEKKEMETGEVKSGYVANVSIEPGMMIDAEEGEILTVYVAVPPPETSAPETSAKPKSSKTSAKEPRPSETEPEPDITEIFNE